VLFIVKRFGDLAGTGYGSMVNCEHHVELYRLRKNQAFFVGRIIITIDLVS
jgi:hypothetical protein